MAATLEAARPWFDRPPRPTTYRARLLRQHRDDRIEVLPIGREPDAERTNRRDDGVVVRRLHAALLALVADVTVEIVDLRAAFLLDVLEERRLTAAALTRDLGDLGEELLQTLAVVRIDVALGRDSVDRFDLVPY